MRGLLSKARVAFALGALPVLASAQEGPDADPPVSVYDDIRARANDLSSIKIVDGALVASGVLTLVVGITKGSASRPACTGTVVAGDMVLTAAHCICDVAKGASGLPDANILVGNGPTDPRRRYYPIIGYYAPITCAGYSEDDLPGRDWGLLQIKPLGTTGMPIAKAPTIDAAAMFVVAGFGAIDKVGKTIDFKKRRADIPSVSPSCSGRVGNVADAKIYKCVPGAEIVAGQRRSPDTCRGDSGGPLMIASGGSYRLAGITSRSIPNVPTACGNGGIYERLTPQLVARIDEAAKALRKRAQL